MEKTAYEEYVAGKDVNLTADSDSVKSYLADMGNIELLSASDENRLSERILSGQCVLALKKEQDKAGAKELDEKGAAILLEKAHLLLCGIIELSMRRSVYAVCNTIARKSADGEEIDLPAITMELTKNEIAHLRKLCDMKNVSLPKFSRPAEFSSDCDKIKDLHTTIIALKKLDQENKLYAPESLALKEITKEFKKACKKIGEQHDAARQELARRNLRLVISIAKKFTTKKLGLSDLIQEGNLGLMIAVDKFDYKMGNRFSTYATFWIRQSVARAIADNDRTVRVPVHTVAKIKKYTCAYNFLLQELGREPSIEELTRKLGYTEREIEEIQMASGDTVSLDEPVGEDGTSLLGDFIEDNINSYANTEKSADSVIIKEKMEEALNTLPDREQAVLRLRFGFKDGICHTLDEIGKMFGVTRERIRQIEDQALKRLNKPNRIRCFEGFLTCFP